MKSTNVLLGILIMHKYIIRSSRAGAKCSPLKLSIELTTFVESTYIYILEENVPLMYFDAVIFASCNSN